MLSSSGFCLFTHTLERSIQFKVILSDLYDCFLCEKEEGEEIYKMIPFMFVKFHHYFSNINGSIPLI